MTVHQRASGPQALVSSKLIYRSQLTIPTEENTRRIHLHHYERLTKRYREYSLVDISNREGSPFVKLRVRTVTQKTSAFDYMVY